MENVQYLGKYIAELLVVCLAFAYSGQGSFVIQNVFFVDITLINLLQKRE